MSLSKLLQISPYIPSTEILPSDVQYMEYFSDNNQNKMFFDIKSPSPRSLLDNEIWIKHVITLDDTGAALLNQMFLRNDNNLQQDSVLALRQGFCTHKALENVEVTINNTKITEHPINWSDHVMRYYISKKENESVVTLSGGKIDETNNFWFVRSGIAAQGVLNITAIEIGAPPVQKDLYVGFGGFDALGFTQIRSFVPITKDFNNPGLEYRFSEMFNAAREVNPPDQVANFGPDVEFEIWERIPCAPFHLWNNKDVRNMIPHIREMQIRLNYSQNLFTRLFGGWNGDAAATMQDNFTSSFRGRSSIRCRWITPPLSLQLPRSVAIPMSQFRVFEQAFGSLTRDQDVFESPSIVSTFNNIRLEQIPDMFFIYVTPSKSAAPNFQDPSEHCAEIEQITFKINGDAGKLVRIEGKELYNLYTRYMPGSIVPSYREWQRSFCTVALRPEDIGINFGSGVTPTNLGVIMSIEAKVKVWYLSPLYEANTERGVDRDLWPGDQFLINNAVPVNIYVACEYRKYKLEMNENAPSKYELQGFTTHR